MHTIPQPAKMPTPEQINELRLWAKYHGRTWKAKLRDAWMSGDYGYYGEVEATEPAYLQQVRNTFGPSWLVRFELFKAGGWSVFTNPVDPADVKGIVL